MSQWDSKLQLSRWLGRRSGATGERLCTENCTAHSLQLLSPEMSVGREGMGYAEGFVEELLEEGEMDRFILAGTGRGKTGLTVRIVLRRSQPVTGLSNQAPDRKMLGVISLVNIFLFRQPE